MEHKSSSTAILVDLVGLCDAAEGNGPQWGHESEDLDLTLLSWTAGQQVAAHVNNEVDVVMIVVAGAGEVLINGQAHQLMPGQALLVPKGAERAIRCTAERFSYLSLHRRRRGLWPSVRGANQA